MKLQMKWNIFLNEMKVMKQFLSFTVNVFRCAK